MAKLKPWLVEDFNGQIWRMEIDAATRTLFTEIRNEAAREVSFAAIDLLSQRINFKGYVPDEKWLTGIEAAHNGVLLLHNYLSASSPTHKGLIAVDAPTGAVLWSNYIYAFEEMTVNGPVVFDTRIQPHKLQLLDINTGAVQRAFSPIMDTGVDNEVIAPQLINAEEAMLNLPEAAFGNIVHYLEHNNYRIVSLHALREEMLVQMLYVMEGNDVLFTDLLNSNIQKIQPEAFVLHSNQLIYLKNKSQINVINL